MKLPIYIYGHSVLRKKCEEIDKDYPDLKELIDNMWETMYHAKGMGIAAPQVGKAIRLFIIDTLQLDEEDDEEEDLEAGIKQVFINATIIEEAGKAWGYDEGCLSIPDIRGKVTRKPQIRIQYYDENFEFHDKVFTDINARVIQHEYDHIEGILFTDHLSPIKKRLLKKRLLKVRSGQVPKRYKMVFAKPK